MKRSVALVVQLVFLLTLSSCSSSCVSWFAHKAEVLDAPVTADLRAGPESGGPDFDHSTYAELLEAHVDYETARVDYAGLKADKKKLDAYLSSIAEADLRALDDDEQLALLINAYNAYTLALILQHYPDLESIKDIDSPWDTKRWVVGGHKVSLDGIEHGLIRPIYKDSRIHFAVNCASIGCPPLADWPYEGAKIDDQLDRATRRTLRDERYARVENDQLKLTSVMNWYRPDFVSDDFDPHADSLPEYVALYADAEMQKFIEEHGGEPAVSFIDYDWSLNDIKK